LTCRARQSKRNAILLRFWPAIDHPSSWIAKWTELPDAKDCAVLQQVAHEIGKVKRAALICRAANPYPLTELVQALPLEALPDEWG
jgi:hypothetical protein